MTITKEIRVFDLGGKRDTDINAVGISWAAGFYDGEGSVSCGNNNGNPDTRIQLSIGQKDYNGHIADTLEKFKAIVKCGHIYQKVKTGKEINQHQFLASKASDVYHIITLLWYHLSTSKKEQAKNALFKLSKGQKQLKNKIKIESKERTKRRSEAHIGQIPWNKGKTGIYSKETLRKMGRRK